MSYQHQLDRVINCVKGLSTQYCAEGLDPYHQMKTIDVAREKSGLGCQQVSSGERGVLKEGPFITYRIMYNVWSS